MAEENTTDNTTDKKDTTGLGQFDLDKIAGIGMSGKQAKGIDTTDIDKQIAALEKPASGSVYDKLAARYRSQGEGAVLRAQKNITNLFGPTVNLIQQREADAQARFTLLKDKLPEFDDTKIFGMQSGNEMPIVAEIESISKTTKEDMRMLSRLNPNDERYDEIKKRIEKNQDAIVAFDEINQKLLEIRNSQDGREDDSQWSRGMDATTRQMWEDIYASKGENITIQDGKLVWTNTKTTTSYEFKGGSYEDDKYTALGGLGGDSGDDTPLSNLAYWTRDDNGKQKTFKNGQTKGFVKSAQRALIKGGFTDADGNELDPDGEWGPKSQAAYDKYLAQKDELETAWLDENLTDEEKKKFGTTTGGGETRTIDLNEIGDGPTMIDNLGIEKDMEIQNGIQVLINSDIEVTAPGYESQVNALIRTLNSAGPKGIKSLIFDGFGAQTGDVLKSTNTDSFIKQIIQNNPEEFGIKDINNLTEEEIANAYEIMRSRDVTHDYNNSEGKSQTLQSQYLQWYRNEIDTKVREGKKSKLVATQQGTSTNTSNKSNRSNRSSKKKNKENKTSNFNEAIAVEDGDGFKSSVVLPTLTSTQDNKEISYENAELVFENGIPYIQLDPDNKQSFEGNPTGLINLLTQLYPDADRNTIRDYVNDQIDISKDKATNEATKISEDDKKDTQVADIKEVDIVIDKLLLQNTNFGERETSDYLLSYGDDDFVVNSLNREYGDLGFTFEYEDLGALDSDAFTVSHENNPNTTFTIKFDTMSDDIKNTKMLIGIMKAIYNNNYAAASKFYMGEL